MKFDRDAGDLVFRALFSSIFLGLGGEHILSDGTIQDLMWDWIVAPRILSFLSGVLLLSGGLCILLGYRVRFAAITLGAFVIVVSLVIHLPALWIVPPSLPENWAWLWDVFQRSNLVKNLCLLGVCVHLVTHTPGKHSIEHWLRTRAG